MRPVARHASVALKQKREKGERRNTVTTSQKEKKKEI
jgi:hypothetical protein